MTIIMNLQETIRRILREDKKTKSTNKEFSKYKDSKFNSLRDYTLQDIVDDWDSLSDHKNENIKTIKHFINNPDKITDLVYDEKGLEDGYHRLIAAKILKKPRFSYRLVENLQENIRRILREETKSVKCKCGWSWKLSEGGDDPYVCHKCGRDNSDNKNKESIQKTIKEESKVPNKVRRRIIDIDWNVEFATKEVVRNYGSPCKLSLSDFINEVVENVINSLYWGNFSDMDDNSNEWVITYHFLVDYIENNFGDKLKQYYHINCGN